MTNQKIPSLQKQLEAIKKRAGNLVTSNPAVSASKQLENYETRIAATGKNPEDVTDKRNLIEKALRLPENQNAIFDVFELLGRPSKALFGGVNALVDNAQGGKRSVGQAMLEGLSGESKESVKTILKNLTNSNLGDKEGKWDWIDTLDIAGEIFLDPVDWALIPATGGAKLAMDAAQTAKAAGQAIDATKVVGAVADAAKAADTAVDVVKTTKQMKSVSDLLFQGAYKGVGKSIKGADNLISRTLKSVSEDDWYRLYNGLKTDVGRAFKQGGKAFKGILRGADSSVSLIQKAIMPKQARVVDLIKETVKKYDGVLTEEQVSKNIYDMVEYMDIDLGKPTYQKLSDLVKDMAKKGRDGLGANERLIPYADDTYDMLTKAFESTGLGKVDDFIEVKKAGSGISYIAFKDDFFDPKHMIGDKQASKEVLAQLKKLDDVDIPIKRSLTESDIARLTAMKQDPIMIDAAKKYIDVQNEVYDVISRFTKIPVETLQKWSKNNDWRIAHTANDILTDEARAQLAKVDKRLMDVFGGKASVVRARKYNMGALEVNNLVRDHFVMAAASGELKNIPDDLEALAKVFYGTDMFTRDIKSAFNFFAEAQTESIVRNDALQRILLMAADNTLDDPQLVLGDFGQGVPSHMTKVSNDIGTKLGTRLRTMASIYGDKTIAPKLMKLSKDLESGNMMISKGLMQLINRNTSREYANNVFEVLSKFNNVYKTGKTLSPMFNVTNLGGNLFNMAMSGMKFTEIPQYYKKTHDLVEKIPDLMDKLSRGAIEAGSADADMARILQEFIDEGILGPSGELAPLGIAAKLQDMDTMSKYAGKENYNYVDQMVKVHAKDGSFKEKYGYEVREFYDRINQQISDATQPIEEVAGEASSIVSKQDAAIKEVIGEAEVPTPVKELQPSRITYGGKDYQNPKELIKEVKKSIKQNQYWSFKGQRYDKTTDGINSLIKSIDNADAKALITKRIKDIKASGKKITSTELDSIFSRVLVTDFKVVNEAVEGGFTPETLAYLEKAYAKSGDDMEVFAKATRGKNKVAFTKGDDVVQDVAEVAPTPEPADLVRPNQVDYGKVYKSEEVSVRPYTDAELKEIKTQNSWTKEKRAEFKEIRDAEAAEAEANYEYLMKAKDHRVAGKTKKEWISTNKDRTKSAEFLNENSLEKTIDRKNAALDKAIAKLDPELKDAFLSGDGPKINQAIAKTLGKDFNPINNLIKLNMKGNATVDSYSRLAMYLKAKEDPSFLVNLGVDNPMDAVRYALFDPADLSYTEENVLKKLIPFYTFTKKNLVFQMENLAKHSSKYHRLYKGIRGSWENSGIGWEHLPDYQMNQMYIPIPSIDENGDYNYVRVNLPFADAVEFASNPLQRLLSSFTPAVRAPFELATNRQIFTGQPISEFDGQMNKQIPFLGNKAAYALSQTGLDVPLRSITDLAGGLGNMFESLKAGQAPNPLDFTRGLNFTRQGNIQSNINSEMYEDLQAVKDYVSKIKQSGDVLPTIEEIGQSNNPLLNRIKAQLSKY